MAAIVFLAPVFVVLYALTIPFGPWRLVMTMHLLAMAALFSGIVFYFRTGVWVETGSIRERGFFGRVVTAKTAEIGSTILAETFTGVGAETSPQLFVCDHNGKPLIRLRGQFWSREDMQVVVATLDVPHRTIHDVLSLGELRSEYPALLYWFERRPVLAALAFSGMIAAFGGLVLLLLSVLGISTN